MDDIAGLAEESMKRNDTPLASQIMCILVVRPPRLGPTHDPVVLQFPFFPVPEEARVARTAVESINQVSRSICPSRFNWMCKRSSIRSNVPSSRQEAPEHRTHSGVLDDHRYVDDPVSALEKPDLDQFPPCVGEFVAPCHVGLQLIMAVIPPTPTFRTKPRESGRSIQRLLPT